MIQGLQREVEQTLDNIIYLTYFMRGSISYESMFHRTYGERQRIENFIEKRLEQESKKPFPQY